MVYNWAARLRYAGLRKQILIDAITETKLKFDLDEIKRICSAIVDTLGEDLCEVVLRDFGRDDDTIV